MRYPPKNSGSVSWCWVPRPLTMLKAFLFLFFFWGEEPYPQCLEHDGNINNITYNNKHMPIIVSLLVYTQMPSHLSWISYGQEAPMASTSPRIEPFRDSLRCSSIACDCWTKMIHKLLGVGSLSISIPDDILVAVSGMMSLSVDVGSRLVTDGPYRLSSELEVGWVWCCLGYHGISSLEGRRFDTVENSGCSIAKRMLT